MDVREALLEAATKVFAEFGLRGATTRRIAQAAGVNKSRLDEVPSLALGTSPVTLLATGGSLSRPTSDQVSARPAGSGATARNASARQASAAPDTQGNDATSADAPPDQDMQRSDDTVSSHSDM